MIEAGNDGIVVVVRDGYIAISVQEALTSAIPQMIELPAAKASLLAMFILAHVEEIEDDD